MSELNQRTKVVRNLVAWAGHDFSYMPDENIPLPETVALARIAAGLATEPDNIDRYKGDVKKLEKALREHIDLLSEMNGQRNAAADALAAEQEQHEALKAQHAELLQSHEAALAELAAVKPADPPST